MSRPAPGPGEVSRARIWLGLWGGGLAWLVHFLTIYALAEFGGLSGLGERLVLGVSLVVWLVFAATLLTLLAAGAAIRISWSTSRRAREHDSATSGDLDADAAPGPASDLFAGRVGWIAGALFAVAIVFEAIPALFYLRACGVAVLR